MRIPVLASGIEWPNLETQRGTSCLDVTFVRMPCAISDESVGTLRSLWHGTHDKASAVLPDMLCDWLCRPVLAAGSL